MTHDSQVINAVDRVEQVALVSLGIQGINESRANSEVFGLKVPGSDRVTFVQYSFRGKLGIDGENVTVTPTGENSYRVTIPKFIFIGYDDLDFKVAAEDNGVLSWVTADIDRSWVFRISSLALNTPRSAWSRWSLRRSIRPMC